MKRLPIIKAAAIQAEPVVLDLGPGTGAVRQHAGESHLYPAMGEFRGSP